MSRQLRPPYSPKCSFYEQDVIKAMDNPSDIDTFLFEFEAVQADRLYKKRTQNPPAQNWDDNF